MIFCRVDSHSVSLVKEALFEFEDISGLTPSHSKSRMFFAGMDCHLRNDLLAIMEF